MLASVRKRIRAALLAVVFYRRMVKAKKDHSAGEYVRQCKRVAEE